MGLRSGFGDGIRRNAKRKGLLKVCSTEVDARLFNMIYTRLGLPWWFSRKEHSPHRGFDRKRWWLWTVQAGGRGEVQLLRAEERGDAHLVTHFLTCLHWSRTYLTVPSAFEMDGDRESSWPHIFHSLGRLELRSYLMGVVHSRYNSIPGNGLEFRVLEASMQRQKAMQAWLCFGFNVSFS